MKRQSIALIIIFALSVTTLVAQDIEDRHWAFVPPQRPAIPTINADQWSRSPIDRFILAELHQRKLTPGPRATKSRLLRRASLDLLGLPPTRAQVETFLKDQQPGAWSRVVDRLLASPSLRGTLGPALAGPGPLRRFQRL